MKWIKENWLLLILLFVVGIFVFDRLGKDSEFRKGLRESDARIQELDKDNAEKEKTAKEAIEAATELEGIVEEKERIIEARNQRIFALMKKEDEVPAEVEALEGPDVVRRTIEHLGLNEVKLEGDRVVFTLAAAKRNLVLQDQGQLIRMQRDELIVNMAESQKALQTQKVVTFNLWRATLAQQWQISNWQEKYEEKDGQFKGAMKDRKKRWLDGLWKGFVAGVIISFTLRMLLKK